MLLFCICAWTRVCIRCRHRYPHRPHPIHTYTQRTPASKSSRWRRASPRSTSRSSTAPNPQPSPLQRPPPPASPRSPLLVATCPSPRLPPSTSCRSTSRSVCSFSGAPVDGDDSTSFFFLSRTYTHTLSSLTRTHASANQQEAGVGKLASCRAQYYCERTLQEHGMLAFKPSQARYIHTCMDTKCARICTCVPSPSGPSHPLSSLFRSWPCTRCTRKTRYRHRLRPRRCFSPCAPAPPATAPG